MTRRGAAIGLAALCVAGHAGAGEPGETRSLTQNARIAPGKVHESCTKLLANESLEYRFTASAALDFNIHYHRGADVFFPLKRDAIAADAGLFKPAQSEDFCLMWTNRSDVAIDVRHSWRVRS
jgi:hypothetical protein